MRARDAVSSSGRGRSPSSTCECTTVVAAKATLVDTSIWVAVLRPGAAPRLRAVVSSLADADLVWTSRIIIAELIAGAKDQKTAAALEHDFHGFRLCNDAVLLFRQAAFVRIGTRRRRPPQPPCGLIDAYLAVLAAHQRLHVLTADRAMAGACAFLKLRGSLYRPDEDFFELFQHLRRRG